MSVQDLVFEVVATSTTIYDPQLIEAGVPIQIRVTNMGDEDLVNLGFYLVPATDLGDVDNPSLYSVEKDYQDMISWGTATDLGEAVSGGLKITCSNNSTTGTWYFTRTAGALLTNRIEFIDLDAGDIQTFTLTLETPAGVTARRFYVSLILE